ncbi:NosD domain-containing protein [Methanospirillum sp.]|uniref:NosD domain-containing protein n=1 Tax=Methanospirillum sp. TaxID=45200 RepID=UPI001BD28FEB|nr:NosD domain-containing protein [Methanospirillum sp.]
MRKKGVKTRQQYQFQVTGLTLLLIMLMAGAVTGQVLAETGTDETLSTGPDVAIIDATVKMDISEMGEIPLGTIPDERLIITITVKNTGSREAPGYKLKAFLVRADREDEIGTQIGGDITDTRLGAGEVRTYTKSMAMPTHLKKGEYRVMIVLDTSNYFIKPDTGSGRMISQEPIFPGTLTGPAGSVPVYSPAKISKPGYYILKRDITNYKKLNIFEINASGVTFDGGGNTIRGAPTGYNSGIYINAGTAVTDIVIKNVVFEGMDTGIWMYKASNGVISDCTFRNTANMGLRLDQSNQNQIYNNIIESDAIGIGVFQSVGNIIYNNLLKNKHNAVVNEDQKNFWNTELKSGANIIGGNTIGGNAWFDESGEGGFSASAQAFSREGISDTPYSLNAHNIDLYPLSLSQLKSPVVTPVPAETPELNSSEPETEQITDESLEGQEEEQEGEQVEPVAQESPAIPIEKDTSEPIPVLNTDGKTDREAEVIEPVPSITEPEARPEPEPGPPVFLSPYADIGVKDVTGPESGCPGAEFTLSAVIENSGGYDADAFQVRYYLTDDKIIDGKDTFLGERTVKNLLSGTEQTITETFVIPKSIGQKSYYLAMVANTDNSVFEENKENNTGYSIFRMKIQNC